MKNKQVLIKITNIEEYLNKKKLLLIIILNILFLGAQSLNKSEFTRVLLDNMVFVSGGSFFMGSNEGKGIEKPVHQVYISDFYIGKYEVTFDEYDTFCEVTKRKFADDEGWGRGNRPVININRSDMIAYCEWVGARLPTEAEWEYAAKGGAKSKKYKYSGSNNPDKVAWYSENSYLLGQKHKDYGSHPVNTKKPNELGLYNMSGNVSEMCSDWFIDDYYSHSPTQNPTGGMNGKYCILRGGSWFDNPHLIYPYVRVKVVPSYISYDIGFRIALDK